ncbi:hypothetical protein L1887_05699 [Cichorium endivia]|nr:hypothetical protein L1887_05699 [Cichorium endivia]
MFSRPITRVQSYCASGKYISSQHLSHPDSNSDRLPLPPVPVRHCIPHLQTKPSASGSASSPVLPSSPVATAYHLSQPHVLLLRRHSHSPTKLRLPTPHCVSSRHRLSHPDTNPPTAIGAIAAAPLVGAPSDGRDTTTSIRLRLWHSFPHVVSMILIKSSFCVFCSPTESPEEVTGTLTLRGALSLFSHIDQGRNTNIFSEIKNKT